MTPKLRSKGVRKRVEKATVPGNTRIPILDTIYYTSRTCDTANIINFPSFFGPKSMQKRTQERGTQKTNQKLTPKAPKRGQGASRERGDSKTERTRAPKSTPGGPSKAKTAPKQGGLPLPPALSPSKPAPVLPGGGLSATTPAWPASRPVSVIYVC